MIINPYVFGGAANDPDAQAYFDQVVTNGGAALSPAWQATLNTFFLAMKANLYFGEWDQLNLWYNENEIAARTSLVNPAQTMCTLVNAPVFTASTGMQTDGINKYINTEFQPSVDGVKYTTDSAFAGLGCTGNSDGVTVDMGVYGSGIQLLIETVTGATFYHTINASSGAASQANAAALDADYILIRNSNADYDAYKNNAATNFAVASSGLPTLKCFIGGFNNEGVLDLPKAINVLWHGFGSKLIPVSTFRTDLHATGL